MAKPTVSEAAFLMASAYELKWWAVYSFLVLIAWAFDVLNVWGLVACFLAVAIGGTLAGIRLGDETRKGWTQ